MLFNAGNCPVMASTLPVHTIIGANGAVGRSLKAHLAKRSTDLAVRTVSRSASSDPSHVSASCLDHDAIVAACAGSAVVYLVIGIEYNATVWERDWPVIMENVLDACAASKATLIFADNLYSYGATKEVLTPALPYTTSATPSRKALVRANLSRRIEAVAKAKTIPGYAIVRGSDFFGPLCTGLSHLGDYVVRPIMQGQKAQFIVPFNVYKHSITYDDDFGRCLCIAGTSTRALGRAWHVPNNDPLTFKQYVDIIAQVVEESGGPPASTVKVGRMMPPWLQAAVSPFVSFFRETRDMYQVCWDHDYIVDGSDFANEFAAEWGAPTPYKVGFKAVVDHYNTQK